MGNRALWDEDFKPMEARVAGNVSDSDLTRKLEKVEETRVKMELQFRQIKEELGELITLFEYF